MPYTATRTRYWILGWLLLFHAFFAVSVAATADQCDDCIRLARNVLECPHLPQLSVGSSVFIPSAHGEPPQFTRFHLERGDGSLAGDLWVRHDEHQFLRLSVGRPVVDYEVETSSWNQVLRNAEDVVEFMTDGDLRTFMQLRSAADVTREGCLDLSFRARVCVLDVDVWLPQRIDVGIAVDTGQVVKLEGSGLSVDANPLEITPSSEILRQCHRVASERLRVSPDELWLSDADYYPTHPNASSRRPVWQIIAASLDAYTSLTLPPEWVILTLDAEQITDVVIQSLPAAWQALSEKDRRRVAPRFFELDHPLKRGAACLQPTHAVDDRWPVWGEDGGDLFFLSQRPRPGAPWWRRVPSIMRTSLYRGATECVHAPTEGRLRVLSLADGLVAGSNVERHQLQLLRLREGSYLERGHYPDLHFDQASLSPDGTAIVYSADRRHGDTDIFVDEIDEDLSGLHRHRRLCRLDGQDHHPVFLGDGARVCFAHVGHATHEHDEEGLATTSLHVVGAAKPYWENDPPEEVVGGFVNVHRLSVFPDGTRVLVADDRGLWIVDVDAATSTALNIPDLHDPELPNGPPLTVRQPAVSPDGTRLAFSGYRDAGEGADGTGWYIYVCDLDGSNLRRVTPLEDDPVPPYVFPETGKTAFDVAREIALQRMNADG